MKSVFVALLLTGCGSGDPGSRQQLLTIGTNPAGTHAYAVAAGLAKALQENGEIRTTIRPFSGSSVYLPLMHRGEIGLGLNTSVDSYLSYSGLPPFEVPLTNLRLVAMIFPLPIMYMVRADSEIQSVEDLRGRNVVLSVRANAGLEQLHTGILATGGLTPDDISAIAVAGLPDAMRALAEGRADAVPMGLNTALALQTHSALPDGLRVITMGQQESRLPEIMPGVEAVTAAPDDSSVGIEGPIRVAGVTDMLNTSVNMSSDQIYAITRTIMQSWEQLRRDYTQIASTAPADAVPANAGHPYHDGAVRYYREAGLWTEAHQANQESLLAALGAAQ